MGDRYDGDGRESCACVDGCAAAVHDVIDDRGYLIRSARAMATGSTAVGSCLSTKDLTHLGPPLEWETPLASIVCRGVPHLCLRIRRRSSGSR
jgi:hypothetical protein